VRARVDVPGDVIEELRRVHQLHAPLQQRCDVRRRVLKVHEHVQQRRRRAFVQIEAADGLQIQRKSDGLQFAIFEIVVVLQQQGGRLEEQRTKVLAGR
jgi:hypothetical protein